MARDATPPGTTLSVLLAGQTGPAAHAAALTAVIEALAAASIEIARIIRRGPLGSALGAATGTANADGDVQRGLDVVTNDIVIAALRNTPTAFLASEEEEGVLTFDASGTLAVAVDPLDGSSNIDVNVSIGTIFSVYAAKPEGAMASLLRAAREQIAAGYVVYGPHTAMVLTLGAGTTVLVLDEAEGVYRVAVPAVAIPTTTLEFAINTSNYRHWHDPVRTFIDDCVAGTEGPRGRDFNMRWVASLVAETHRIVSRGGVFLYPADRRKGYQQGRLRLLYEAAPIAFLVEQAGGRATDGNCAILDKVPGALHERTSLIFGSAEKVARIESYYANPAFARDQSPLFRSRGFFSA